MREYPSRAVGNVLPLNVMILPQTFGTFSASFFPPLPRRARGLLQHLQEGIRKRVPGREEQQGMVKSGFRTRSIPGPGVERWLCGKKGPATHIGCFSARGFPQLTVLPTKQTRPHYGIGDVCLAGSEG